MECFHFCVEGNNYANRGSSWSYHGIAIRYSCISFKVAHYQSTSPEDRIYGSQYNSQAPLQCRHLDAGRNSYHCCHLLRPVAFDEGLCESHQEEYTIRPTPLTSPNSAGKIFADRPKPPYTH